MSGAALELRGVSVRLGQTLALDRVDLTIAAGEAVALVGPSGAGKTTLLRLLDGAVRPSAGSVRVDGHDLAGLDPRPLRALRSRMGAVHQGFELVPGLRVVQNVLAGGFGSQSFLASLRSMLFGSRREHRRVHELLARLGIGARIYARVEDLSGGERQRVAIARALYARPRLILADEPVSALDPERARDVVELLLETARQTGATLVTSLHSVELATASFPRLVGLRSGRIVFDTRPEDVADADLRGLFALERREPDGGG